MNLDAIWRYPIKSLSGEPLDRVVLNPGMGLPFDRRWALALADGEATDAGEWRPKSQFVVLVKEYGLAQLKLSFDQASGAFRLNGPDGLDVDGNLHAPEGRAALAQAVAEHLGMSAMPKLVEADSLGYFDTTKGPISLLNLSSHRALEEVIGQPLDPVRFRMNFWFEGAEPWAETAWPGRCLHVGNAVLRVTEDTGRCKATHVNPQTGAADVKILHALKEHFGHTRMGVYAQVEEGGLVARGDKLELLD